MIKHCIVVVFLGLIAACTGKSRVCSNTSSSSKGQSANSTTCLDKDVSKGSSTSSSVNESGAGTINEFMGEATANELEVMLSNSSLSCSKNQSLIFDGAKWKCSSISEALADDSISGDSVDGGIISNFKSTGISDQASSEALSIDLNGNIGIGVTVPDVRLSIDGAISLTELNALPSESGNTGKIYVKQVDNDLYFKKENGTETKLNSNGPIQNFYDYGSSSSTSTTYEQGIKIASGRILVSADSYIDITNLPFISASSYNCIAQQSGGVSYSDFSVGEGEEISGDTCRIHNQKSSDRNIKWIAVGR